MKRRRRPARPPRRGHDPAAEPARQPRRGLPAWLPIAAALLAAGFGPFPAMAEDGTPPAMSVPAEASGAEEVWLEVRLNGQRIADIALLLRRDGHLLARREDLERWRIKAPEVTPLTREGEAFFPLDALPGLTYRVDEPGQALIIEAEGRLFEGTVLSGRASGFAAPPPAPLGGFFNYDVSVTHGAQSTTSGGFLELGAFGRWGAGLGNFVVRDTSEATEFIRLDTTWTHDMPSELASLRLGDSITRAGSWGRSVRFGGVQWATNFATQPGFVAFPLPGLRGEAALPSTVELYVNNALRMRREVPAGPFAIQDLPVVTGQGEARLVVRDLLGREQVVTQPYYASPRLLADGLEDFSYEVGFSRRNFGIESNDYDRPLAVGTHRLGFSDTVTGEIHAELLLEQQTAGLGGAVLWPEVGVFSAAVAGSRSERGSGGLVSFGFERQAGRFSLGGNAQLASEDFTALGLQPGEAAPRLDTRAFASFAMPGYGSLGVSYIDQDFRDRDNIRLASASYSVGIGRRGYLSASVLRFLGGSNDTVLGLTFTVPLGGRTSASVSATAERDSQQVLFQAQQSLPAGSGFGYRVLAGALDSDRREAGVSMQRETGTYTAEVAHARSQTAVRLGASGGVALLGHELFLSRRINDSFAVVRVPGYENVRVYAENQEVARTDGDGSALVPRLRAYQKNRISIEQADLPLDAEVGGLQREAVPYYRSGVTVEFPVRESRGALLTIRLEDGEPLPAGAVVTIVGSGQEFPVGLGGEAYLTGLSDRNRLRATWRNQSCEFDVSFRKTPDPLPHLGTETCKGVKP